MQPTTPCRPSLRAACAALAAAVLPVVACGPGMPPPAGGPVPPVEDPAAEPAPAPAPRLWLAGAGVEAGTLVLEGPTLAPGTVVEVLDAAGPVGAAEVSAEPPPECDGCPTERFLARTVGEARPFEGSALALHPSTGGLARVVWAEYPSLVTLGEDAVTWAEVDADGDRAVDLELVVWCGSFVPSGCDGRVCEEVCRGTRVLGGGEPADVVCEGFIPDVEDCLPEAEDCVLVEGGCQECGTDCRDIALTVPQAERWATYESEGVRMEFDLEDVLAICREHDEAEVLAWVEAHAGRAPRLDLRAGERELAGQRVALVVAALLERGRARVVDPGSGEPVERLVQMEWFWMGCGGRCRQSGREWRLRVPGEVFFKTTDLYGD